MLDVTSKRNRTSTLGIGVGAVVTVMVSVADSSSCSDKDMLTGSTVVACKEGAQPELARVGPGILASNARASSTQIDFL
jgi:hypothetical protein